ncbi:MAG TPA: CbrC family protein [Blastocatellia bacterium]|nr:CbrC family protein [Blastocatellia bacterium]
MKLPAFRYHPDPLATGSIEAREIECVCCGKTRDHVYAGPVYAEEDLDESICPWCISDGLAHEKFDAEFTDLSGIGGYGDRKQTIPQMIEEEIAWRTPGFSGWQQERWLVHCSDACAFLGPAGKEEVEAFTNKELLNSLQAESEMDDGEFREYFNSLRRDHGPTAYIFKCLHCGQLLGYSDCH